MISIGPWELKHIRGCGTFRDVWTKLENVYASKDLARKAALLKRFTQHKMQETVDVAEHLAGFFDGVNKLEALAVDIDGELLAIML